MEKLKIVKTNTLEQEIEEINLPNFDINANYDENWFTDIIKQHELALSLLEETDEDNDSGN